MTPSFRQGKFLERTLRSVLDQDYPRLEYIVQDGGSKDETVDILKRYQHRLAHWESAPDNGQTDAINRGFRRATGDILAYLNSDDLLLPGALAFVAQYFHDHPEVNVIYSHRIVVDVDDQEVGRWVLPKHDDTVLTWCDFVPQETLFWRRSIWEKVGSTLDESFQFAMDWDLLLRFREVGARFVRVPRFLGAFRVHPHQKTSAQLHDLGTREINRLLARCHGRDIGMPEVRKNIRSYLLRHVLENFLFWSGLSRAGRAA